ncbi:uncharacterized protein RSE6_05718 [Rhynchosporium secalis]|uniref:C2 domain-containing protein n=1 Tax=Rhynchosporium secalis TaxID=38038 RepID=A0A1E1M8K0_RHYSE|nr:uncharacterized protein RSE6_05718 [Rhynchosporium secalis]
MSGSSSGDLGDLIEKGWKYYRVLAQAPPQLDPLSNSLLSMIGVLRLTNDAIQGTQLSATEQWVVKGQKAEYSSIFEQIERFIYSLRSNRSNFDGASTIEDKILEQVEQLSAFLDVFQSSLRQKITTALSGISDIQSTASDWEALQSELRRAGISERVAQENFFFIDNWVNDNVAEARVVELPDDPKHTMTAATRNLAAVQLDDEDDKLPGYTPGAARGTIEEKVQSLEQTTMVMYHSEPIDSAGTSSNAPPGYTFEAGHDEQVDQDFNRYIKEAIDNEASRRAIQRIQNPDAESHVYSWLPEATQSHYRGRKDIAPMLDPDSFSVMAYQTAPRCNDEIERLMSLLRVSFEHKNLSKSVGVINDAFRCLDSMSKAVSKFMLLQDQHALTTEAFSDMDAIDIEYSTATSIGNEYEFPMEEYDFCQKSYYRLLTYIMGMLEAFAYIFQGRTYISRSRHELELLWQNKKMDMRTAWIDKQLAGSWDDVEHAVLHVRDWRAVRPIIRAEAMKALEDWQSAARILSGSEMEDKIEITIISASSFPKTTFGRPPSLTAKATLFAATRFSQARILELKTDVCKSQNPVWDQSLDINLPKNMKFIDIEIWDRVSGFESQLAKVRLPCSNIPGIEANFAEKSLLYGFDEELQYDLHLIGKGKEVRPPTIKLRLKWAGRHAKVEEANLPFTPPGKMFKSNLSGIPLSQEERNLVAPAPPGASSINNWSEGSEAGGKVGTSSQNPTLRQTNSQTSASGRVFDASVTGVGILSDLSDL